MQIDRAEQVVDCLMPILDELLGPGLVAIEKVQMLQYQPGERQP